MRVETVRGPISVDQLGSTLMHEHLTSLLPGRWPSGGEQDDAIQVGGRALVGIKGLGVGTVVDLTTADGMGAPGRGVEALRAIAEQTEVHIVAASAFYKDPFLPDWVVRADIDDLVKFHIREVTHGIDDTSIKAGIFGEVGSSLHKITSNEEKCLRAIARAHRATKVPISTHCTLGTMALEQVALFREEGADLDHVVIGHMDLRSELDYLEEVLATGVTAGFDTAGKERFDYIVPDSASQGEGEYIKWTYFRPDADRLTTLAKLIERGYEKQIVLSLDLTGYETFLNRDTIGTWGYAFLHKRFLPALQERGVNQSAIKQILVDNPARILAVN